MKRSSGNYGDQGRVKVCPKYAKYAEASKWDLRGTTDDLRGPRRVQRGLRRELRGSSVVI